MSGTPLLVALSKILLDNVFTELTWLFSLLSHLTATLTSCHTRDIKIVMSSWWYQPPRNAQVMTGWGFYCTIIFLIQSYLQTIFSSFLPTSYSRVHLEVHFLELFLIFIWDIWFFKILEEHFFIHYCSSYFSYLKFLHWRHFSSICRVEKYGVNQMFSSGVITTVSSAEELFPPPPKKKPKKKQPWAKKLRRWWRSTLKTTTKPRPRFDLEGYSMFLRLNLFKKRGLLHITGSIDFRVLIVFKFFTSPPMFPFKGVSYWQPW